VQDVRQQHAREIDALDAQSQLDRLCELNVLAQARHVGETTIVQDALARRQLVQVHAWIYGLHDGLLRDLGSGAA
jgi:carbonic anhydrase